MEQKAKMRCPNCGYYYGGKWVDIVKEYPISTANAVGQRCKCCEAILCIKTEDKATNKTRLWIKCILLTLAIPFCMIIAGAFMEIFLNARTWLRFFEMILILSIAIFILFLMTKLSHFVAYLFAYYKKDVGLISISDKVVNIFEKKKYSKQKCHQCIEKYSPEKLIDYDNQNIDNKQIKPTLNLTKKAKMRCPNCGYYYGSKWWFQIPLEYIYSKKTARAVPCHCCNALLTLRDKESRKTKFFLYSTLYFINIFAALLFISLLIVKAQYKTPILHKYETLFFLLFFVFSILSSYLASLAYAGKIANFFKEAGTICLTEESININIRKSKKLSKDKCRKCIEKYTPEKLAAFDQQIKDES